MTTDRQPTLANHIGQNTAMSHHMRFDENTILVLLIPHIANTEVLELKV